MNMPTNNSMEIFYQHWKTLKILFIELNLIFETKNWHNVVYSEQSGNNCLML